MILKILGVPFSKQSFRVTKSGKKYQAKEVIEGENNVRAQIICQIPPDFKPWECGVWVESLLFVFPWTSSITKKVRYGKQPVYKTTKPDLTDNLQKGLFDAMQGVVFINDSLVCHTGSVEKIYGDVPRIEIDIRPMV